MNKIKYLGMNLLEKISKIPQGHEEEFDKVDGGITYSRVVRSTTG